MRVLNFTPPIADRAADVLVFHTDHPFQLRLISQNVFGDSNGYACVGVQKLAQQVVIWLFSPTQRSGPFNRRGSQLADAILASRIRTAADVHRTFAIARESLLDQFQLDSLRRQTTPADERLADIELLFATVNGDELTMTIRVTSAAGEDYKFVTPITLP